MKITPVAKSIDHVKHNKNLSKVYKNKLNKFNWNMYLSQRYWSYVYQNNVQNFLFFKFYRNLINSMNKISFK